MAFWPIWRLSRRKRPPSHPRAAGDAAVAEKGSAPPTNTATVAAGPHGVQRKLSRRGSRRRNSTRWRASTKDSAAFEKRLGEKTGSDLSRMDTAGTSDADTPPGPRRSDELTALPDHKKLDTSPHLRPITREYDSGIPYNFLLLRESSNSSPMPHATGSAIQRVGSNKRSATGPAFGRKLSKRRKDERIREEEIRAMSQPHPSELLYTRTGSVLRKDSRKMKSGLNRHLERPSSTISLPLAESIHSSMSSDSSNRAIPNSAFHVFAPRPSIRLSAGRSSGGLERSRWAPPIREPTRGMWRAQSVPLATDSVMLASRTIDDLADDLDAGALRDLMERDARRTEKKRKQQEERLRQKLERRAERQRLREQRERELAESGVPTADPEGPSHTDAGLGIETKPAEGKTFFTPADEEGDPFRDANEVESPPISLPKQNFPDSPRPDELRSFLDSPTPMQAARQEVSSVETPLETPQEEIARAIQYAQTTNLPSKNIQQTPSPPTSPIRTTQLEQLEEAPTPPPPVPTKSPDRQPSVEQLSRLNPVSSVRTARKSSARTSDRRTSDTDPRMQRKGSGWTAFFRRGTSLARHISGSRRSSRSEASFSNTSRESMARQALPPHLQPLPPVVRQRSTTQRTQSKFVEDLPETELPISPPDSRVQSPEITIARADAARKIYPDLGPGRSSDSPAFDERSARSISPIGPAGAGSALMSASLASVDSEASWLSGKPSKRAVRGNRPHQGSVSSSTHARQAENPFNGSYEELGMPDEEYFQRLTPRAKESAENHHISNDTLVRKVSNAVGYPILENDADAKDLPALPEGAVVHGGVERHPTVVHRNASAVKSREGLVKAFLADEDTPRNSYIETVPPLKTPPRTPPKAAETTPQTPRPSESDDYDSDTELPLSPEKAFRLERARSVDLGKGHVRHLSAGSAKLLDIPPSRRHSRRESSTSPGLVSNFPKMESAAEAEGKNE